MNQTQKIQYTSFLKELTPEERHMHMTYMLESLREQLNEFEDKVNLENNMDITRLAHIEFLNDYLDNVMGKVGTGPNNI